MPRPVLGSADQLLYLNHKERAELKLSLFLTFLWLLEQVP